MVVHSPSGSSSIFGDPDPPNSSSPPQRQKIYRMASSFELGDEQPSQEQIEANMPRQRRRSKLSVNPLTGELIGNFGASHEKSPAKVDGLLPLSSAVQTEVTPATRSGRIPPGGYSTPLW